MPDRNRIRKLMETAGRVSAHEIRAEDFREVEEGGRKFAEIEVSMASSRPLNRSYYIEELRFDGMDRSWMDSGNAPVYFGHNRGADRNTPRSVVGRVVSTRIEKRDGNNEVLFTTLRFALGDKDSREIYDKIQDGLLRNVSLGWKADYERAPRGEKAVEWIEGKTPREDVLRYNYWSPREASIVGLPADSSVGFGRDDIAEIRSAHNTQEVADVPNKPNTTEPGTANTGTRESGSETPEPVRQAALDNLTLTEIREKLKEEFEGSRATDEDIADAIAAARDDANGNPVTFRAARAQLWKIVSPPDDEGDREEKKKKLERDGEATRDVDGTGGNRAPAFNKGNHVVNCGRFFDTAREHDGDLTSMRGLEGELLAEHRNQKGYKVPEFSERAEAGNAKCHAGALSVHIPHRIMEMDPNMSSWFHRSLPKDRLDAWLAGQRAITQDAVGFAYPVFDGSFFIAALREKAPLLRKVTFMPGQLYQNLVAVLETGDVTWAESAATSGGVDAEGHAQVRKPHLDVDAGQRLGQHPDAGA